jgi:hypothetical protein
VTIYYTWKACYSFFEDLRKSKVPNRKVQIDNDTIDDSDSDDEFASPSYDELADLLKEYTQIIRKSKAKCDKMKDENEFNCEI